MPDPKHGNPMQATRITIKGSSGYCPVDIAFHDRVSLTPHSIDYTYKPYYQSEMNRPRRWFYKTDSPIFSALYHQVETLLPRYLKFVCNNEFKHSQSPLLKRRRSFL